VEYRAERVINERQLAGFRACELAPGRLYEQMPANGEVLLISLPPGVGKSRAAQEVAGYALQHEHDLIIYAAPTRGIIEEMIIVRRLPAESVVILKPRPQRLCGAADAAWKSLECSGCAALAKATLCEGCAERDVNGGDCSWPDQLDKI
jgi:DNA polymerase III delta prime subunit